MNLVLTMGLTTAAFFDLDGDLDGTEVARILHRLADDMDGGVVRAGHGTLRDLNGNTVGTWRITPKRDGAI